jgi:hypothetical protein
LVSLSLSLSLSLCLIEEHRLKVFENKVLMRISGPKKEELTGRWSKLYTGNEELHTLYPSPSIVRMFKLRRTRWTGRVTNMNKTRNAYMLVKRPFVRPRHRWEDNVKLDLMGIDCEDVKRFSMAQNKAQCCDEGLKNF